MRIGIDSQTGEKLPNIWETNGVVKTKQYSEYNIVINVSDTTVELLYYKEPFKVPTTYDMSEDFATNCRTDTIFAEQLSTRKFELHDGIVVPLDSSANIRYLIESRKRSAKASIKRFYNYALDNDWQYFCTWTFADSSIRSDKDLLYKTYNDFVKMLRKRNPDVKAIAVYEEFEKGGYHMHALVSNVAFGLTPAINPKTGQFIYSEFNNQIFNCIEWNKGFSTVVCINPKDCKEKVVNYLSKYLAKDSAAPFGCKRFFRTRNLSCRDGYMCNLQDVNDPLTKSLKSGNPLQELLDRYGLQQVKDLDGMTIYKATVSARGELNAMDMRKSGK